MDDLARQAIDVLRANDRGSWTRPSPRLYPHQWSWDAAIVAVGWAHLDPERAVRELTWLFDAQWDTGMVPHVRFDLTVARGAYEPGPNAWATAGHAPPGTATSAICQPPVHAVALARVRSVAAERHDGTVSVVDEAIRDLYPKLVRWHRWLRTARDPDGTGLVAIVHPWESGMDNSPRWDRPMAAVRAGLADRPVDLDRPDLTHVADPSQRPTQADYQVFHHLAAELARLGHDQAAIARTHPFRVDDVWTSAILARADDALATMADRLGEHHAADEHRRDAERTRAALDAAWDADRQRCGERDHVNGEVLHTDTIARFAPLLAGCDPDRRAVLVDRLTGPSYAGAPDLAWPLPPSTATTSAAFDPRAYWRGPQWPPMTWLLTSALAADGHARTAARLRAAGIAQLRAVGCHEYVDPVTGDGLGSNAQSWTAAVALDWLGHDR